MADQDNARSLDSNRLASLLTKLDQVMEEAARLRHEVTKQMAESNTRDRPYQPARRKKTRAKRAVRR